MSQSTNSFITHLKYQKMMKAKQKFIGCIQVSPDANNGSSAFGSSCKAAPTK